MGLTGLVDQKIYKDKKGRHGHRQDEYPEIAKLFFYAFCEDGPDHELYRLIYSEIVSLR